MELSSQPWGASPRCWADACFLGLARGAAQPLLTPLFLSLRIVLATWLLRRGEVDRRALLPFCNSGSTPRKGDFPKVTQPSGPSLPCTLGSLRAWHIPCGWAEGGAGGREGPLTCPTCALVLQCVLTRLPGPQQDGRYQGSSLLFAVWASVCPSLKGLHFQETFWEGLEEGLPEGPVWEPPAPSSGVSRDLPAPRLILEARRPP